MSEGFESVLTVDAYYDGPRTGTANFRGLPHRFRSFGWLPDGDCEHYDHDDDRFLISPADAPPGSPEILVRGKIRARQPVPDLPPGVLRPLEVLWIPISD